MHGEIDLTSLRQILDIAIAPMLRPAGNNPRAILLHLFREEVAPRATRRGVLGIRRQSDDTLKVRRFDELSFAFVPFRQDLCGGRTPELAWMHDTWESYVGDMARGGVDALEIPDGLGPR